MSRKEEDFKHLEGQLARQEVALEKRLNEIRRLEAVNAKLLEALELAVKYLHTANTGGDLTQCALPVSNAVRVVDAAIKAAKGAA